MATKIQLKRRTDSKDETTLAIGEPFYDVNMGHLYVGDRDGDSTEGKVHIAQIQPLDNNEGTGKVAFYLGKDKNNMFEYDTRLRWKSLEDSNE